MRAAISSVLVGLSGMKLLRVGEERQQRDDRPGVHLAAVGRQLAHRFRHRLERRAVPGSRRTPACSPAPSSTASSAFTNALCTAFTSNGDRMLVARKMPSSAPAISACLPSSTIAAPRPSPKLAANTSCAARLLRRSVSMNFSSSNFAGIGLLEPLHRRVEVVLQVLDLALA